jgi:N-acetyl-anhydromuramyl-L-alanine amidase AmpD
MKRNTVKLTQNEILHILEALNSYGYDIELESNPKKKERVHMSVTEKLHEALNG